MTSRLAFILACSALLELQAVAAQQHAAEPPVATNNSSLTARGTAHFQTREPRYQVEAGDSIELSFSPTVEYNQTVSVQPDGYITLREVGDVFVRGKTIPEVREIIRSAYSKILRDPEITILLKDFDKPHFTATGQVGRPGKYELRAGTRVSEALAIAGGMTEKAKDSQVVLFRRVSNDWVETKLLDMKAVYKGRYDEDIDLRPGDMIFVPQNRISKIKPFLPTYGLSTYMAPGMF